MKINAILTTKLKVDPIQRGLQEARIEVWVDCPGKDFHYIVGKIEVWHNDELFEVVRAAIHRGLNADDTEEDTSETEAEEPSEGDRVLLVVTMDGLLGTLGVPKTEG